jgi:hypothetical protein
MNDSINVFYFGILMRIFVAILCENYYRSFVIIERIFNAPFTDHFVVSFKVLEQ